MVALIRLYNDKILKYNPDITKDWWLYDTGSPVHIANNTTKFINLEYTKNLQPLLTGHGYIKPTGIGTIILPIRYNTTKQPITLNNALYIPEFPLNLVSAQEHHRSGGSINDNQLLDNNNNIITEFDYKYSGYFLPIQNQIKPKLKLLNYKNKRKFDFLT